MPPGSNIDCTQGTVDYGVFATKIQADWEEPGSCGWHLRTCALGSNGVTQCGGWVKATELVTQNPAIFGTMASGWLQEYLSSAIPQRWCIDVYRTVESNWRKCAGTGSIHSGAIKVSASTTAKVVPVKTKHVAVTWFHICLALDHSLCATSNGVGRDLSVVNSGYNKWQAIPDGSGGKIMWQNGSGNCAAVFNGAVQNNGSACTGAPSEDVTVGGSGNVTFNESGTELFWGTNGASNGKLIYAHPAMAGFDRGWVTFSCC
jgi:hypothetical protein